MTVTKGNLIMGPGSLYLAEFGETEPTDATAAWPAGWTDFGATQDGVSFGINQEFKELEVDQVVDVPGRRLIKRDTRFKTNLAEATLENLAVALNMPASVITTATGKKTLTPTVGMIPFNPDEYAIGFEGLAPLGYKRRVIVRSALQIGNVEQVSKKDGQKVYPVEFAGHWVSDSVPPFLIIDGIPTV